MPVRRSGRGLTLIELLVVVSVVAILGAISVVNYLEFQTRAKVSQAHNDLRVLATAAETYFVDHNTYPPNQTAFIPLVYPTEYLRAGFPIDPFDEPETYFMFNMSELDDFAFNAVTTAFPGDVATQGTFFEQGFLFTSAGPDESYIIDELDGDPDDSIEDSDFVLWLVAIKNAGGGTIYDPTNGTFSSGDIGRTRRGVTKPVLIN